MPTTILIVDDEPSVRESLKAILATPSSVAQAAGQDEDYVIVQAESGEQALAAAEKTKPDVVLLDIIMPGMDGIAVLERLRLKDRLTPVIMLTATKTVKTAVDAMKLGATDYLTKPFDVDELKLIIRHALERVSLEMEVRRLRDELASRYGVDQMIGKCKAMQDVLTKIDQLADAKTTVLITGESGTGKELVARALHYRSKRREKPFIAINCAAIPDTLIEAELFGHEKGAFTDAQQRRLGQFELANQGTLFLDEIADVSAPTQSKLLRVLQEREFTRLGSTQSIKVDVRLITATNKDLEAAMRKGAFREDLYYRINVVPIHLPPVRERREDIPLLLRHFVTKKSAERGQPHKQISPEALTLLTHYPWPGNIREMENVVEQILTMSDADQITPDHLPLHLRSGTKGSQMKGEVTTGQRNFEYAVMEFERELIVDALKRANFVQTHAAQLLGISRRILKYKMDSLGITGPEDLGT
jgi:two-component system, NtrC family, response regulator AtoC